MILGEGVFGLAVLALWAYCIFDVIRTDESLVQNLPKMLWLLIVVFVPTIGSIAWLLLGRPSGAAFRFDASPRRERPEPLHPSVGLPERQLPSDDHQARREEALRRHQAEREQELRRREEDLRRREEELRRREEGLGDDQQS
jgi:phospholipase D-like protein